MVCYPSHEVCSVFVVIRHAVAGHDTCLRESEANVSTASILPFQFCLDSL